MGLMFLLSKSMEDTEHAQWFGVAGGGREELQHESFNSRIMSTLTGFLVLSTTYEGLSVRPSEHP